MSPDSRIRALGALTGALLALSAATASAAATDRETRRAATAAFVHDRAAEARHLLLGPARPAPPAVLPGQDCATLYARRLALMRTQYDYKPAYTDDPRNRAAVFIGTIFTPAFYYLAFTGIQSYTEHAHDAQTQAEIDALRYASALRQCYVR